MYANSIRHESPLKFKALVSNYDNLLTEAFISRRYTVPFILGGRFFHFASFRFVSQNTVSRFRLIHKRPKFVWAVLGSVRTTERDATGPSCDHCTLRELLWVQIGGLGIRLHKVSTDTSLKRTVALVLRVSTLERVDCSPEFSEQWDTPWKISTRLARRASDHWSLIWTAASLTLQQQRAAVS